MIMKLRVVSEDADECIGIDECRAQIQAQAYGDTDVDTLDDTMILGWLKGARQWAEAFTGLAFIERSYEGALDEFPTRGGYIEIPVGPVIAVASISIGQATSSSSDDADVPFTLDEFSNPQRLKPAPSWPTVAATTNGIRVLFTAGYGVSTDAPEMPPAVRAAILLLMTHLYENRAATTEKAMSEMPLGAESFLRHFRINLGMA